MHAEPKNVEIGTTEKIQEKLRTKFAENRLMSQTANPFFPDKCLGAGCAEWACRTAEIFVNEFYARLSV